MARRWTVWAAILLLGGWLAAGCLYRVQTPLPPPDTPTVAITGAAPPTAPPTPVPAPEPTSSPLPTAEPSPSATVGADEGEPAPIPEPTIAPPSPQLPIVHTFVPGESLHGVVAAFLNERLGRRVSDAEVREAVRILLQDPANDVFRARPALVRPDEVLTLTSLITHTQSLKNGEVARR